MPIQPLLKLVGEPDNVEMLDVLDATREEFNRAELALGTVVAVEERNAQELVKAKKDLSKLLQKRTRRWSNWQRRRIRRWRNC